MGWFYDSVCLNIIAICVILVVGIVTYCKWVYKYWERLGVPYLVPSIPFGNNKELILLNQSVGELSAQHYRTAKAKGYKHVGIFGFIRPEYMPIDLKLLKHILAKDFNYFSDRGFYYDEEHDPLSGNLFLLGGNKWKKIRSKLTPTFTSGKMKMMFNSVIECSQMLKQAIDTVHEQGPIDIKHFLERFTTDVIGSCAFGLNCNSFNDSDSDFCKYSKRIFSPTAFENLKGLCTVYFRSIGKFFKMNVIPADVSEFFLTTVRNTVEYRKANNVIRNDFLQILIDLMKDDSGLTIEEIAAQAFVFFGAGFETSSTVMMYCLLELSLNQDIQEKLRAEVNNVMNRHDQVTYDGLNDLVYMRQVLDEVMRKHPPLAFLTRACSKDYQIPNTNVVLKKDTAILISIFGLQHDPEYFPEPEKFDPERFSPENKEKLTPFSYMPFGEGPRLCIGLRFAFLQMKIALSMLLKDYKFSINEKTELPLKINPKGFVMSPMASIWLDVEKI
ncbi:hypothetical protein RN001_011120 [Aquatica leii]|uniref:Cytochrome P450 n=1 Tax=Aquatica leii TaxID=1421715 RepID=A0AAN7PVM6_9COLE|nr:hypothetical protein RN001_011120 [Aquatica leii]